MANFIPPPPESLVDETPNAFTPPPPESLVEEPARPAFTFPQQPPSSTFSGPSPQEIQLQGDVSQMATGSRNYFPERGPSPEGDLKASEGATGISTLDNLWDSFRNSKFGRKLLGYQGAKEAGIDNGMTTGGFAGLAMTPLKIAGQSFGKAGELAQATVGDLASPAGSTFENIQRSLNGETLPLHQQISDAAAEEKDRGEFGVPSLMANISKGIADMAPKMLAMSGGPLATAAVFGTDAEGDFHPVAGAVGAALPGISKLTRALTGEILAKGVDKGAGWLANSLVDKGIHLAANQAAMDAVMIAQSTPELMKMADEDPREFKRHIAEIVGSNLAFAIPEVLHPTPLGQQRLLSRQRQLEGMYEKRYSDAVLGLKLKPTSPETPRTPGSAPTTFGNLKPQTPYGGDAEMVNTIAAELRSIGDRNRVSAKAFVRSLVEQWGLTPEVASDVFSKARERVFGPAKTAASPSTEIPRGTATAGEAVGEQPKASPSPAPATPKTPQYAYASPESQAWWEKYDELDADAKSKEGTPEFRAARNAREAHSDFSYTEEGRKLGLRARRIDVNSPLQLVHATESIHDSLGQANLTGWKFTGETGIQDGKGWSRVVSPEGKRRVVWDDTLHPLERKALEANTGGATKPTEAIPAATPTADVLLGMSPDQLTAWKKATLYGPETPAKIAAGLSESDLPRLIEARDALRKEANDRLAKMEGGYDDAAMMEANKISLKAQTLNEVIEEFSKPASEVKNETSPKITAPSALPVEQRKPAEAVPEVQAEAGTAQPQSPDKEVISTAPAGEAKASPNADRIAQLEAAADAGMITRKQRKELERLRTESDKVQISTRDASAEFNKLILEYGSQFEWPGDWDALHAGRASGGSTMAIEAKKKYSKALQSLRHTASRELGLRPDQVDTPEGRAKMLPLLKNFIEAGGKSDNQVAPEGVSVDSAWMADEPVKPATEPKPAAEVPKLRAGETAGELLQGSDAPFNLAGEKQTDFERIAAEKKAKEDAAKANEEFQKKNQLELGAAPVKPAEPTPETPKPAEEVKPFADGSKVQIKGNVEGDFSPQLHTVVRETTDPKFPDERLFEIRNDRTGEIAEYAPKDMRQVKERTAEQKAAAPKKVTKAELDKQLRDAGLDPSAFPDKKSKQSALDRAIAKLEEAQKKLRGNRGNLQLGIAKVPLDAALGVAIDVLKAGRSIAEAVESAIAYLRSKDPTINEDEARGVIGEALKGKIAAGRIEVAASEIPRLAEPAIESLKSAESQLDEKVYTSKQYRDAQSQIMRAIDYARTRAMQDGREGITLSPLDPNLAATLEEYGIPNEEIPYLQEAIRLENSARSLANKQRRLAVLRNQIETLERFSLDSGENKFAEQLESFREQEDELLTNIQRQRRTPRNRPERSEDDPMFGEWDTLVRDRAREIITQRAEQPVLEAKRRALYFPEVQDTFVKPINESKPLLEQFGDANLKFETTLEDENATPEQKRSVAISLIDSIYRLGYSYNKFKEFYQARQNTLTKEIRALEQRRSDASVKSGLAEVLLDDAMRTMMGDRNLSGTIQDRSLQENLRESYGAVITFAERLYRRFGENGARRVLESLIDPSSARGEPISAETMGIAPATFDNIINWLSRSREFNDAVQVLTQQGEGKIADLPITKLETLQSLLTDPESEDAQAFYDRIKRQATEAISMAEAAKMQFNRQLYDKGVELASIGEANRVFESVFGTPGEPNREFERLHKKAVEQTGMGREMVVDNGGSPNSIGGNTITYRAFGDRKTDLVVRANDSIISNDENFRQVKEWFDDAENYLTRFYEAQRAFDEGTSEKSPEQLGFDRTTANGLEYAIIERYPAAFDPAANVRATRFQPSWYIQKMTQFKFWRQFLRGSEFAKGSQYRDLLQAQSNFFNGRLDADKVMHRFTPYIARARSAALRSHPELGNVIEEYIERVWNPMATFGRREDSELKVGMKLGTGFEVTPEDMALMKLQMQLGKESRMDVTETTPGRGVKLQEAVRGIRVGYGNEAFHRRSGSVGKYGVPRIVSVEGRQVISDMAHAYREAPKIDNGTNFGADSDHPVIRFWNANRKSLVRHILDALVQKSDRIVPRSEYMQQAEAKLAERILEENSDAGLNTVQDVVEALAGPGIFPEGTGLDVLGTVRRELMQELGRYQVEAAKREREAQARAVSTGTEVGRSLNNEFTKPAAKLWLPSNLFDNGAISDGQLFSYGNRMTSDRAIEYASALDRAHSSLVSEVEKVTQGKVQNYEGKIEQVQLAADILGELRKDFVEISKANQPGGSKFISMVKSVLLGNPNVGLRNFTLGQMAVYMMNQALHRTSRALAFMDQGATFMKAAGVAAKGILYDPARQFIVGTREFMKSDGAKDLETMLQMITDASTNSARAQVQRTGFSMRQPIWLALGNQWRRLREYDTRMEKYTEQGKPVRRALNTAGKTIQTAFRWAGTEVADVYLNFMAIDRANRLMQDLETTANTYGKARESLGKFDPTNPEWVVKPEEYSGRLTKAAREQNLETVRLLLRRSGITLEHALWNHYQAQKEGKETPILSEHETNNVLRSIMREYNASDMANRPVAMTTNPIFRMLAHFQGYSSDFTLKLAEVSNGVEGQSKAARLAVALPTMAALSLASAIIGQVSLATSKPVVRALGLTPNYTTMFEKDWWKKSASRNRSLGMGMIASFPIVGDIVALGLNTVVGNRGFSPSGRILAFNILDSAINVLRGFMTPTQKFSDKFIPAGDEMRRWLFFYNAIAKAVSPTYAANADYRTGISTLRTALQAEGVPIESKPGQQAAFTGSAGPTRRMIEAMDSRDPKALQTAFDELVAYHKERGAADPEKSALATLNSMNPAQRAGAGRKPTDDELAKSLAGMTPEARKQAQKLFADYSWGAAVLNGNAPSFTRGDSGGGSAGASSGGGGGGASRTGGSRLRASLGAARGRVSRVRGVRRRLSVGRRRRGVGRISGSKLRSRLAKIRSARRIALAPRIPTVKV